MKITDIVIFLLHVSYTASGISTMTEVTYRISFPSSLKAPAGFFNDIKIFIRKFYARG